jgi:gas vesicle protein
MKQNNMNPKTMKVTTPQMILGLAVAAAAGAAIGMLLAPEKGTELQNRIREGTRSWIDEIAQLLKDGKKMAEKGVQNSETQLHEMKSNLGRIEN